MATGDQYRVKAADMYGRVSNYSDPSMRAHFENLALSYLRLAEQADRREAYEHPAETHPTQHQQQPQRTDDPGTDEPRLN